MKQITNENGTYVLRIDRGEDVIQSITDICILYKISAGYFTAIGACGKLIIAYYNLSTKTYEDHQVQQDLEIVSLSGNIALFNNQPVIHTHGVFAKRDLSTIGGHIKQLIVSATCEVVLTKLEGKIVREKDAEIGLNLLK